MGKYSIPGLFIVISLMVCCNQPKENRSTTRAFYYWKSRFSLNSTEQKALSELGINRLYVKFFDVVWNEKQGAVPVAKLNIDSTVLPFFSSKDHQLVPVVFITNESISKTPDNAIVDLGEKILRLYNRITITSGLNSVWIPELQIDCDWTESTREKYFKLLDHLQTIMASKNKRLSATIRLYQCKYFNKTGVPPVSRGLLMCYNMGNLKDPGNSGNSIIEPAELRKYIGDLQNYPLPLDIALPLFEWKVLIRNNSFEGLMQELPDSVLADAGISKRNGNNYEIVTDTLIHDYPLKKGDLIRIEKSRYNDILAVSKALSPKLKTSKFVISLYHLDSVVLSKYNKNELENIYNSLH
jgi:hypothetical protein